MGGCGRACVHACACVYGGKGLPRFYLNKIVYVTVMFIAPVGRERENGEDGEQGGAG